MKHFKKTVVALAVIAAAFSATVAASSAASSPRPAASPAACQTPWGSGAKSAPGDHTAGLLTVRTGRHPCFDRVVYEFAGVATGYRVNYAADVLTVAQGASMRPYTAGGALLSVVLRNPASNAQGTPTYRHTPGDHAVNVLGYQTLRDSVYGGSFEGLTVFAVGVRAQLPFRVFHLTGPGTHQRIVLDIAHHW